MHEKRLPLKQHFWSPSQSESLVQSSVHDAYLLSRGTFGQTPCLVLSRHTALKQTKCKYIAILLFIKDRVYREKYISMIDV